MIGDRKVGGLLDPVFIIAEIGINHLGDVELCTRMIEAAAAAGADAVKLQTVDADESYTKGTSSYNEFKGKELDDVAIMQMIQLAAKLNVILFSTPGDFASLKRMIKLGMPAVKISSGLMTNVPLIKEAARHKLPLIISTGLAYEKEISEVIDVAQKNGAQGLAILKCTALYPAPDDSINLSAIPTMRDRFGVSIGYSDHTLDDLACIASVALGASIIEKHFTIDRSLPGADHSISMETKPFSRMVKEIRRLQLMRGTGYIQPTREEEIARPERHRCLVAKVDIGVGEKFTADNVALLRPAQGNAGLPPSNYEKVLMCIATRELKQHDPINEDAIQKL